MSQATRTRGLITLAVLLTAAIALGLLLSRDDAPAYELTTLRALDELGGGFAFLPLEEARERIAGGGGGYTFVDLRSPDVFSKGHLGGAINIPMYQLLEPGTLHRLEDSRMTYVLYGEEWSVGASACALLRQLGLKNIQALQGCYHTYSSGATSPMPEGPRYDFRAVFEEVGLAERGTMTAPPKTETPQKVILPQKRVTRGAGEGC